MKIQRSILTMTLVAVCPAVAMSAEQDFGTMPGNPGGTRQETIEREYSRGRDMETGRELEEPSRPEVFGKEPGRGMTAQDQSTNPKSLETTRSIRQKISERKDLSFTAKNIEIVTDDQGAVTLRGRVRGEDEKQTIEQIAKEVASPVPVTNQLVVEKQ